MSCLLRSLLKNSEVKIFKEVIGLEGKCYREMKSSRRWLSIYKNNGAEREKRILELLLISKIFPIFKGKSKKMQFWICFYATTKCTIFSPKCCSLSLQFVTLLSKDFHCCLWTFRVKSNGLKHFIQKRLLKRWHCGWNHQKSLVQMHAKLASFVRNDIWTCHLVKFALDFVKKQKFVLS